MLRQWFALLIAAAWLYLAVGARAQQPAKDGKQDLNKGQAKELKAPDGKSPVKDDKSSNPPARPTLDKMKLPADAIVILIEKLQDAADLIPKAILVSPKDYQDLLDRIRSLEQQLKLEKATIHSCKLTGKLDGDYLVLRVEFTFATMQPKTAVALGLQGAHLVDEGELDKALPQIDYGDDGFVVRVEKEGTHHLTLNLKAPIGLKRGVGAAAPAERFVNLGLPGAPATSVILELSAGIKEVRINDAARKSIRPGSWDVPLGAAKQLSLLWKEPQAQGGGGPLTTLDAQITVDLKENAAHLLQAELTLEDLRAQTKDWRLLLPPGAKPTVTSHPAGAYEWTLPGPQQAWHVLKIKEASGERVVVSVQAEVSRSAPKLPAGPFALVGAFRQQGSVLVQAASDALRGQRLVYHRSGEVTQRDLPKKSPPGVEALALFQYATTSLPGTATPKPPVELEFKANNGLAETQTDHTVRLKGDGAFWHVETTTRIQAKSLADVTDFLDVQLPQARANGGLELLTVAPAGAFPATALWLGLLPAEGNLAWAAPWEFRLEEEGTMLSVPDAARPVRLRWSRQNGKQLTLTIHGKYMVPYGARNVRLELPRPRGSIDRGATLTVHSGPLVELLTGPAGAQEAVPERQRLYRQLESAPVSFDLIWRPYQPALAVSAIADVIVHENSAQVRQHIILIAPGKGGVTSNVRLRVPAAIQRVTVEAGGKLLGDPNPQNGAVWVATQPDSSGKCDVLLEYDLALPKVEDGANAPQPALPWDVPLIWPDGTTHRDARVRVWTMPGSFLALAPGALDWHERGIESVAGRDSLPTLVVHGTGANPILPLQVRPMRATLAALVCDRTLIQVRIDDEGNHLYRARFLIRKLSARQLTLELPAPVRDNLGDNLLSIRLGADKQTKALPWTESGKNLATMNIDLGATQSQPVFLDVEYKVPASFTEGRRGWQVTLFPPNWHGEVLPGAVRWQVDLSADQIALVLSSGVTLDYRWALNGWLLAPEASVTSADLEAWLTGRDGGEAAAVSVAFWRPGLTTQRLVHFPRQAWLLLCSGLVLALGLAWHLTPMARVVRWLAAVAACAGILAAALFWPAVLPSLLFGCEPGLAVLVALLGLQWLLQEHYRRQVVVMPGFARLQTGSTLNRAAQIPSPREVSTVDAPSAPAIPAKSSVK